MLGLMRVSTHRRRMMTARCDHDWDLKTVELAHAETVLAQQVEIKRLRDLVASYARGNPRCSD